MPPAKHATAPILPRKEPVQARSKARFERILSVAVDLIVEEGVDAVAMSDIASTAEISIASLYQYFPDKASIIATMADRYNEEGQICVREAFATVTEPKELISALHEMIDGYYEFFEAVPGAKAIWQASQSDPRLQSLDAQDMERLAQTVNTALAKTAPNLSKSETIRLARLYTGIIGTVVRSAIAMTPKEANASIALCKHTILTPSVEYVLNLPVAK